MPILERYRGRRSLGGPPYSKVLRLTALLCVLAIAGVMSLARYARTSRPEPAPPAEDGASSLAAPEAYALPPDDDWEPLSREEERELLAPIVDQVPLGVREHREAYYYLINRVRRMTHEEMGERLDTDVEYQDYELQPHVIRGAVVQARGLVMRLEKTDLASDKAGLPSVWEGQMVDRRNQLYSFVLTEPPHEPFRVGLRMADGVWGDLRGIFMQVIAYPNREDPPQYVATPLIIGKGLRAAPVPPIRRPPVSWPWIAGMAALAAALGVWLCAGVVRRPPPRRAAEPTRR